MRPHNFTPADTVITDYCDTDSKWGPLLFLRPARSEHFSVERSLALAIMPGVAFGLLGSISFQVVAQLLVRPALPLYAFPLLLTTFYFCVVRLLLAPSWNRRADLLSNGRS